MTVRTKTSLKLVGVSSAALMIVGAASSSAMAAGQDTATVAYNCNNGLVMASVSFSNAAPPAKIAAGQTLKLKTTSTFGLDAPTTQLAETALGWSSFDGKVTADPGKTVGYNLKIDKTQLGNNADGSTSATAHGKTLVMSKKTGKLKLSVGNIGANLQGYDASGAAAGAPFSAACVNTATTGTTALADSSGAAATVKVVKDTTKTKVSASAKGATVKAKAKVKSHFGLKAKGKVKFTLMKGTKKVASASAKLKGGVAKATFKHQKSGKYTVKAKYVGSKQLKGSTGKGKVSVK